MTTQAEIRSWLLAAKKEGATHMLVVCDTFDHDDYPVSVKPGQNVREVFTKYSNESMQRVMEVYNLSLDIEAQLNEHRARNF